MLARNTRLPALTGPGLTALAVALVAALLIVLPPLLGMLLIAGATTALTIVLRPRWGFYLLLLSIPVQDLGAAGELTLTNALFALTLGAWLLHRLTHRNQRLPNSPVGPAFAVFVGALALSLIVAREPGPGLAVLFQWLKSLLVYFLALDLLRTRRQVALALGALTLAGTGEAAIGLFQYVTGAGPASFAIGSFSRAYGTFGRPNSYAGYLEMIFPVAIFLSAWLWSSWRWQKRRSAGSTRRRLGLLSLDAPVLALAASTGVALIGAAILASLSRGAWLGTAGGVGVMLVLASRRGRALAIAGAIVLVLFGMVGGFSRIPADIQTRLASIVGNDNIGDVRTAYVTAENFAILERRAHWEAGLEMFASNRWLGVGLGNFNVRYEEFGVSPTFLISQGHAHNYYIQVAAEAGIIGLGAYLLLLAALLLTGLHALATVGRRDPFARAIVVAGLGTVVAVAIHNIFEVLHVLSMGIQLSTIWAFFTIAHRLDTAPDATSSVEHPASVLERAP